MQFLPHSSSPSSQIWKIPSQRGSFVSKQTFWVPTPLCYLEKCSFCPIFSIQVVRFEKFQTKGGVIFETPNLPSWSPLPDPLPASPDPGLPPWPLPDSLEPPWSPSGPPDPRPPPWLHPRAPRPGHSPQKPLWTDRQTTHTFNRTPLPRRQQVVADCHFCDVKGLKVLGNSWPSTQRSPLF